MANDVPFTRYQLIQVNATLNGGALVHWIEEVDGYSFETELLDDFMYSFNFDEECVVNTKPSSLWRIQNSFD